jgi:hypothetical protein
MSFKREHWTHEDKQEVETLSDIGRVRKYHEADPKHQVLQR